MRAFVIGVAALAFGATLSACSSEKSAALAPVKTDPAAVEKLVADLAAETFKGKSTAAADVAAVRDALPKDFALTWGGLNFDQASGATVLTAVKLTPAQMPTVGLSIDEIRLWDFDADFAKARLAGQRLTETASLASRVEMKGIAVFGLESLMAPVVDAAEDAVDGAAPTDPNDPFSDIQSADLTPRLENYHIGIGRVIVDDLVLRPYEIKPVALAADNEFAQIMPVLQGFAAAYRTIASNASVSYDTRVALTLKQLGQTMAIDVSAKTAGSRGSRGGDVDVAFARDLTYLIDIPGDSFSGMPAQKLQGSAELYTYEGMRFEKLLGYLARGEWPPRTEANLLSIGLFRTKNESLKMNGVDFYSVAESFFDAREFHWFIPTKLSFGGTNMSYNIEGLMQYVSGVDPLLAQDAQAQAEMKQVVDVLKRYELSKPVMDYRFDWNWNADSGAAKIAGNLGIEKFLTFDATFEGGFPSFKAVSDLVPDNIEQTDGAAIGAVFEKASTLKLVNIEIVDNGGLDKSFGLAAEIAKMQPASPDAPNPMANMTPEAMRSMAAAGVYMVADQATSQVASAGPLIRPLAAFIEKGGRVKISVAPKEPVQLAAFSNGIASGATTPDAAIQQLNVKVEHMPPAGK